MGLDLLQAIYSESHVSTSLVKLMKLTGSTKSVQGAVFGSVTGDMETAHSLHPERIGRSALVKMSLSTEARREILDSDSCMYTPSIQQVLG